MDEPHDDLLRMVIPPVSTMLRTSPDCPELQCKDGIKTSQLRGFCHSRLSLGHNMTLTRSSGDSRGVLVNAFRQVDAGHVHGRRH